jgi:hypothetical protein
VTRPEDLPLDQQAWIRRQVDRAPELSESQRARLEPLLRGAADEQADA